MRHSQENSGIYHVLIKILKSSIMERRICYMLCYEFLSRIASSVLRVNWVLRRRVLVRLNFPFGGI